MLARRYLRLALAAAIERLAGVTVQSPGDWESVPANFPEVKLRTPSERKASLGRQAPAFTTSVGVEILGRVDAVTAEEAQDKLDDLGAKLEAAIFGAQPFIKAIQQVASCATTTSITAKGARHLGELQMQLECETFETFYPSDDEVGAVITEMLIHLDLVNPTDPGLIATDKPFAADNLSGQDLTLLGAATGTEYPNPAFPDGVAPAPRTTGRDGRDEAALVIPLGVP